MDASPGRAEAQRWLVIAGKLLEARDLLAAKKFAERAIDADPLLDGPDQILAAADVILASQSPLSSGHPDHYSILQLPGRPSDLPSIKRSFRRLALLLRPPPDDSSAPTDPVFHLAFHLVSGSFSFLSDDDRRRLYDRDLLLPPNHTAQKEEKNRKPSPPTPPQEDKDEDSDESEETFWTVCPNCFRVFEYAKEHEGRRLRCHVCRKPFHAVGLPSTPPIVPGTDMFYCSWGLFPVGFPGFSSVQIPPGTPTVPSLPSYATKKNKEDNPATRTSATLRPTREAPAPTPTAEAQRKAPRKVMANRPRRGKAGGDGGAGVEREVVADGDSRGGGGGGGFDMNNSFGVDLDHRSAVLGNLANLPFLKDDEIAIMR